MVKGTTEPTTPKQEAIQLLKVGGDENLAWTAKDTFRVRRFMASSPEYISAMRAATQDDRELFGNALLTLLQAAGDNHPMVHEIEEGNGYFLELRGEKAADVARTLRDEGKINFSGSANIPQGRARG